MNDRTDRVRGGLWGMLVGDALGVPYEFHDPADLPPPEQIEMDPPEDFPRAHRGTPIGTWSDDGAQALCLLDSLFYSGELDIGDLGRRFVNWYRHGYMAVEMRVFDIGYTTRVALHRIEQGGDAGTAGGTDERDNGNGSLMRVLPLALWHQGGDGDLVADAHAQSKVTHGHERAQVCCALYCLWARRLLRLDDGVISAEQTDAAWDDAASKLSRLYRRRWRSHPRYLQELEEVVLAGFPAAGSGYVLDSLHSARVALAEESYEEVVKAAIGFGQDTDTTACIAGGLAGIRFGEFGIPMRWREAIREPETVETLLEVLERWLD